MGKTRMNVNVELVLWYMTWSLIVLQVVLPIYSTGSILFFLVAPLSVIIPSLASITDVLRDALEMPKQVANHLQTSSPQQDMEVIRGWTHHDREVMREWTNN